MTAGPREHWGLPSVQLPRPRHLLPRDLIAQPGWAPRLNAAVLCRLLMLNHALAGTCLLNPNSLAATPATHVGLRESSSTLTVSKHYLSYFFLLGDKFSANVKYIIF